MMPLALKRKVDKKYNFLYNLVPILVKLYIVATLKNFGGVHLFQKMTKKVDLFFEGDITLKYVTLSLLSHPHKKFKW